MSVTGISDTKWFGQAVYEVEEYTILHSRCLILGESQTAKWNEGAGIILDPQMIAWREAGEIWKAVSSRIITARIELQDILDRQSSRRTLFMTVMYQPTKLPQRIRSSLQLFKKPLTVFV